MFDKSQIPGHNEDTEWFSDAVTEGVPTKWRANLVDGWRELCYISSEQINDIKLNYPDLQEQNYDNAVWFIGESVVAGEEGCSGSSGAVPLYWQFNNNTPVLGLAYLTSTQINYVKQKNLHQVDLNQNYFGPNNTPCYSLARII